MTGTPFIPDFSYQGFEQANYEAMEMLQKAMTAGSGVDASAYTGGRALSIESLDQTLVNILFTQDEAVLFQTLKKQPVKSVIHQWDTRTEVGADDAAWADEADSAQSTDQTIARNYTQVKFLQTLRTVTLQASLTNMIEDAVALEKDAGTRWLIRNVEKGIIYGNPSFVAEQPLGLKYGIPSTNVLDLRGADATGSTFEDLINQGARTVRQNYGRVGLLNMSPTAMQDVQKLLRDRIRFEAAPDGFGSRVFTKYPTPFGTPVLKENIFITEGGAPAASSLSSLRPAQPSIGAITATGSSGSFTASDAGLYYYQVVAVNKYGDSVASTAVQSAPVAAGNTVSIPVTFSGSPTALKVYRSQVGAASGADCRYAFTVAATTSVQTISDTNSDLPGCSDAYLLTIDPEYNALEWLQFLPMMKFDLYPTSSAVIPFLMLMFGSLAIKKGVQQIRIKNIAPSTLGWF